MIWLKHIFALLLAAAMIFMGVQKFGADNFIFSTIAQNSGISLFEPVVRIATGVMEVVAGLLMILPATRAIGALFSTGIVAGAIVFHLSPWLGVNIPFEPGGEASPTLFIMAVVFFVLALINLVLNKGRLPFIGNRSV